MQNRDDRELEVLDHAIQAVEREAGIRLEILPETENPNFPVDAVLKIQPTGEKLFAEIKKWAPQANLGALINQIRGMPGNGILIADYINTNMAERLRKEEIQFIDGVGNAYLNQPGQFIYVKGNREKKDTYKKEKDVAQRAFEPKGLIVVYAFLCYEWILNEPYRTIADRADVAVGTVGWVINALKAGGYIRKVDWGKARKLVNHQKLLDRWVEAWPQKLKPKLHIGEFEAQDPYWWEQIDITKYDGYWGGEVAAAKYTNYLKPEEVIVYIPKKNTAEFFTEARLRKLTNRNRDAYKVHVYEPFWPKVTEYLDNEYWPKEGLVHPILAYADLIATEDTRNLETAEQVKRLYGQHIDRQFIPED